MCEHEKLTEGLQRPQRCCLRRYCSLKDNLDVVVQMWSDSWPFFWRRPLGQVHELFPPDCFSVNYSFDGCSAATYFSLMRALVVVVMQPFIQIGLQRANAVVMFFATVGFFTLFSDFLGWNAERERIAFQFVNFGLIKHRKSKKILLCPPCSRVFFCEWGWKCPYTFKVSLPKQQNRLSWDLFKHAINCNKTDALFKRGTNKTKGFVQSDTNEVGSLLDVQVFFGWRSDSCFNTLKAF